MNTPVKQTGSTLLTLLGTVMLCIPLFLTGCMSFNPKSIRNVKSALAESNPQLEIEEGFSIAIGALTIDFVDFALVHDEMLDVSKISRAEIGVFQLADDLDLSGFRFPENALDDRRCPRRDVIVRVREESEHVLIAACIRKEKVTGISVFVLEPREIVVLQARGDFESLLNQIVKHTTARDKDEIAAI